MICPQRVTEIQSFTENASWNYCPTGDNSADLLTREMQTGELSKSVLLQSTAAEQLEAISTFTSESTNNPTNVPEPKHGIAKIINLSAYSKLPKLVRVAAWVLRCH